MKIQIKNKSKTYTADLSKPIDISIPIGQVKCFYAPDLELTPYKSGDFIGSVRSGAPVNFFNVFFNPHGTGTHTECLGHITKKQESVNQHLKEFHFLSQLVSVKPTIKKNKDKVITLSSIKKLLPKKLPTAIIIRTLPNLPSKKTQDYSGTNPCYLSSKAMAYLVEKGIKHLLIDLPSVDKEVDAGKLAAHHIFWKGPSRKRLDCTITEMVYIPNKIKDGLYLLNLQIASLELDASPSKPVLYKLK